MLFMAHPSVVVAVLAAQQAAQHAARQQQAAADAYRDRNLDGDVIDVEARFVEDAWPLLAPAAVGE